MGSIHTEEHQGAGDGPETCSPLCGEQLKPWTGHSHQQSSFNGQHCLQTICLLHKAVNNQVAVTLPPCITQPTRHTRQTHQQRYLQVRTYTKIHQYSFFPRTIKKWNGLPPDILAIHEADLFKTAVSSHIMHWVREMKWWCFMPLLCTLLRLNWAKQKPGIMRRN